MKGSLSLPWHHYAFGATIKATKIKSDIFEEVGSGSEVPALDPRSWDWNWGLPRLSGISSRRARRS